MSEPIRRGRPKGTRNVKPTLKTRYVAGLLNVAKCAVVSGDADEHTIKAAAYVAKLGASILSEYQDRLAAADYATARKRELGVRGPTDMPNKTTYRTRDAAEIEKALELLSDPIIKLLLGKR